MISRRQIIKSQQQHHLQLQDSAARAMQKAPVHRKLPAANTQFGGQSESEYSNGQLQDYRHFDPYSVYGDEDEEEDVWYSEERLFEDHMQEIINKWMAIDDEIWAKIICMERNRRIAKAYARKHSLTINGSRDEYLDGTTLGLNSFDNPDRDAKTRHIKQYIGHGLRIKITQEGDIVARRMSKSNIFLHLSQNLSNNSRFSDSKYGFSSIADEPKETASPLFSSPGYNEAASSETSGSHKTPSRSSDPTWPSSSQSSADDSRAVIGLHASKSSHIQSRALEFNKSVRIFDMEKFKALLESETKRSCPDRKFLQNQCISVISFVVDDPKMLNLPSWIMVINIVAIDLLKSKLGFMTGLDLLEMPGPFEAPDEEEEEEESEAVDSGDQTSSDPTDLACTRNGLTSRPLASRYTAQRAEWPPVAPVSCLKNANPTASVDEDTGSSGDGAVSADQHKTTPASSSSGFNSHCSSQNNSSANSSSSSATNSNEQQKKIAGTADVIPKQTQVVAEFKEKVASAGARYKQQVESSMLLAEASSRGKRPPKLPHRLLGGRRKSPVDDCQVTNANLILVAPTGFSPPTAKRKGRPIVEKMLVQNSTDKNPLQLNSIKLIDENGHCRIIKPDSSADPGALAEPKVPLAPGIPAHAQLAPPATQRKILSYLMSHNNIKNGPTNLTTDSDTSIYAPTMNKHPRPLPMLPSHQKKLHPSRTMYDENLYYCGLQARVPVRQKQLYPSVDLKPPVISAMMKDIRCAGPMYQHHQQLHHLRQQRSLNNLNRPGYQLYQTSHPTTVFPHHNINKPTTRPLLKLFKKPHGENPTPTTYNKETRSMFLSADNINQRPHKLSTIFDLVHFPMKLGSSKNKLKT